MDEVYARELAEEYVSNLLRQMIQENEPTDELKTLAIDYV